MHASVKNVASNLEEGPCTFGPFQCIIIKREKTKRLARANRLFFSVLVLVHWNW